MTVASVKGEDLRDALVLQAAEQFGLALESSQDVRVPEAPPQGAAWYAPWRYGHRAQVVPSVGAGSAR